MRKHKHDKLKYRMLSFIEQNFLNGNQIAGFKNYELIRVLIIIGLFCLKII